MIMGIAPNLVEQVSRRATWYVPGRKNRPPQMSKMQTQRTRYSLMMTEFHGIMTEFHGVMGKFHGAFNRQKYLWTTSFVLTMRLESNQKQRKLVSHSFVPVVMALSALQVVVPASNGKSATPTLSI